MAITVAISPGTLIFMACLQNILAQQLLNNNIGYNFAGAPQQLQPKTQSSNQIAQNSALNFNSPQQANFQPQMNQQQSNIQQAPFIQQPGNMQPQLNQFSSSQQPGNSNTNPQLMQQQNQNLASNIFSALYNIRQPTYNQASSNSKGPSSQQMNSCGLKENIEQTSLLQSQNQPTFIISNPVMNKPQNLNQPPARAFVESEQFHPTFTFQAVPSNNAPSQQTLPMFPPAVPNLYTNDHVYIPNQPTSNSGTSQQTTTFQSPVMIPGAQTNSPQNQPIILTFQAPQTASVGSQPTQPTSHNQPTIYTMQTQPTSANQYQQMVSNQQGPNVSMDKESLMSYVMSQIQNTQGNNNALASILPALLNTKSEKSSSMKALLPLIFNLLSERGNGCGGCGCPYCTSNNNNQNIQEPIINSGYSNQKNYSQQETTEEIIENNSYTKNADSKHKISVAGKNKYKQNEINENSSEPSEEEEDEEESEEEDDYE